MKPNTLPSNQLDSLTTAQLLERAKQCIETSHAELSNFYEKISDLMEKQREFDSMRPLFNLEPDSKPSAL